MEIIGRYTVREKLGQGGMGIVYQVHDPQSDTVLALKVLRDIVAPLEIARLQREFELLSRLSHPNVVRVFETGLHDGRPYFTMELLLGTTLGTLLQDLPRPDENLWGHHNPQVFRLLLSLCNAIEYIHHRGIIHRDLKPNNVMFTAQGATKLMDFGLARDTGMESELTQTGVVSGTFKYCSPEQIDHTGGVDSRTDLYLFGIMLYEMCAGRPPFEGEGWALLRQVLTEAPPPLSQYNPALPAEFATLVSRLLEKNPAYRFQSAGKLRQALSDIAMRRGIELPGRTREDPADGIGVLSGESILFTPRYVPPAAELARVTEFLAELETGHNGFCLVYGDEGIGKTRFAEEVAHQAEQKRFYVLRAAADAEGASPYHAIVPMLQQACRAMNPTELEAALGSAASLVTHFLMPGETQAPADQAADKLRLFDVISRLLRLKAQRRPVVLVVDDIQWADVDSFELLSYLVRDQAWQPALDQPGIGVVWLCEGDPDAALRERLERLTAGHAHVELRLPPLSQSDMVRLVGSILGDEEGAARLGPIIFAELGGNPGFAFEALKRLVEGRVLREDGGSWIPTVPWDNIAGLLPTSLPEAYGRRVRLLPAALLELLHVAALLGVEFSYQDLLRCADQPEAAVLRGVDGLLANRILRGVPGRRQGRFAFASPHLRRYLVQALSFTRKKALHGQILRGLQLAHEAGDRRVLHALAVHAKEAGDAAQALHYVLLAAESAAHALANERAADLYLQAAVLPGFDTEATPAVRESMFDVLMSAGRYPAAQELAEDSAHPQTDASGQAHWLHRVGRALMGQGKSDEALHYFNASLESFGFKAPTQGPALLGSVAWQFLRHLPRLLHRPEGGTQIDTVPEALEVMLDIPNLYYFVRMPQRDAFFFNNILRAFNTAHHLHRVDMQLLVESAYAYMLSMLAHPPVPLIRRFLERASTGLADIEAVPTRIEVCRYAGYTWYILGDFPRAQELLGQCVETAQSVNNARGLSQGSVMLALTYWWVGPVSALYRTAAVAAVKCEALGDAAFAAPGRMAQAAGLALEERYEEAEQVLKAAWKELDHDALTVEPLALKFGGAFLRHVQRAGSAAALWEDLRLRWLQASMDHLHPYRFGLYASMAYIRLWQLGALIAVPPIVDKIHGFVKEAMGVAQDLHFLHGHLLVVQGQVDILQGHIDRGLSGAHTGLALLQGSGAALLEVDCRLALVETLHYAPGTDSLRARAEEHRLDALHQAAELGALAYVTEAHRLETLAARV